MAQRNVAKDQELKEIQAAAEKMAERMNVRFVLNVGKVREFIGLSNEDNQENHSFPTDDVGPNRRSALNC